MTLLMAEGATISLEIESLPPCCLFRKSGAATFFDTLARPGTVWFRASLRLLCIVSGERAAPPVLVGVDVIRRAEVRFAPQQHVVQHRQKALAHGREGVLHPGRNLGIDLPVEKAVGLQLAELPGQGWTE